jgi:DNA-binding HxlR family transcriptional regulator
LGDACATAHGMELIGGRWTYPIFRELVLGPKRFNALVSEVRGITPAVLSARLHEMAASGLIEAVPAGGHAVQVYALTEWAMRLVPVLREIGRWAQDSPVQSRGGGLTPDAAVQAMMTMARPDARRRAGSLHLVLHDDRLPATVDHAYRVRWGREGVTAVRVEVSTSGTSVRCDSSGWGQVLFAGLAVSESGAEIVGDHRPVAELLACFGVTADVVMTPETLPVR